MSFTGDTTAATSLSLPGPIVDRPCRLTAPRGVATLSEIVATRESTVEVSIRELKNRLSQYLKQAQTGKDVVITSHGRAIARLVAIEGEPAAEPSADELLKRLKNIPGVRAGAGGKPRGAAKPLKIKRGEKTLAELVLEERR